MTAAAVVVYRNRYLSMAEMVRNILTGEGLSAVVRATDPFGGFSKGPHFGTYQPTPCSMYEVIVPEAQAEQARECVEDISGEHEGSVSGNGR